VDWELGRGLVAGRQGQQPGQAGYSSNFHALPTRPSPRSPAQVAFDVHANELGGFGRAKNWVALSILLLMLVGIASEKVHRM
jgi:hypothetical protein